MKEKRECWLLQEFGVALGNSINRLVGVECGEEGSSDGRLIIEDIKVPVQIVSAEGVKYRSLATARKNKEVTVYDVKSVEWIKNAIDLKVRKKYTDAKDLTILIEYSGLNSVDEEYLSKELLSEEIQGGVRCFKEVYILSPSDTVGYIERYPAQNEPILFKVPTVN